jgi:hypothetical protein
MAVKRWNGTAWEVYAGADLAPVKVTDGRVGKTTFIGATSPTGQVDGDIWIDQDTTTNAVVPTALTTKGDIFAATGNAAYTRFAAGNNGESLYADSTTSTGLRWQGNFNAGKNKIINGDFSIWQRGTTFTFNSAGGYTADRFNMSSGTGGVAVISRQTFTPGQTDVPGNPKYYMQIQHTTDGGTPANLDTRIEDVNTFSGQNATFSFYGKVSSGTAVWTPRLVQFFGTGGSATNVIMASDITLTTLWQRFTVVFPVPSTAGKTIGEGNYLRPDIYRGTTGVVTYHFANVQFEAGSIATPFTTNTANPQQELAACQRYFQIMSGPGSGVIGSKNNGTTTYFIVPLKVNMRAAPSMTSSAVGELGLSALNGSTTYPATSFSTNRSSPWSASFGLTQATSDGSAGGAGILLIDSGSGWVAFSAEL